MEGMSAPGSRVGTWKEVPTNHKIRLLKKILTSFWYQEKRTVGKEGSSSQKGRNTCAKALRLAHPMYGLGLPLLQFSRHKEEQLL